RSTAQHAHCRSLRRTASATAAAGGARAKRRRPPRPGARHHLEYHWPRSDPAALRHLLGVAALARGVRTDRIVLRRSLAQLQTTGPGGEGRRDPRGGRILAGGGCHRPGALPRKICAFDEQRRRRPRRLRDREQAGRRQQRRIRRGREDGGKRRYARRVPARNEEAIPGRDRSRPAAAGNPEGRSVPDRLVAGDRRIEAGRRGKVAVTRQRYPRSSAPDFPPPATSPKKICLNGSAWYASALEFIADSILTSRRVRKVPKGDIARR